MFFNFFYNDAYLHISNFLSDRLKCLMLFEYLYFSFIIKASV